MSDTEYDFHECGEETLLCELTESDVELQMSELARVVRRKSEQRPVPVAVQKDGAACVARYKRLDTGAIYKERRLHPTEIAEARQATLPIDEPVSEPSSDEIG